MTSLRTKQSVSVNDLWIASFLIMTKSLIRTLSDILDCFVPRNDGDLTRHHSFLQWIYHMPGATNDKQKKHPPTPFKGGTFRYNSPLIPLLWREQGVVGRGMFSWLVIFACLRHSLGSRNDIGTFKKINWYKLQTYAKKSTLFFYWNVQRGNLEYFLITHLLRLMHHVVFDDMSYFGWGHFGD